MNQADAQQVLDSFKNSTRLWLTIDRGDFHITNTMIEPGDNEPNILREALQALGYEDISERSGKEYWHKKS